MACDSRARICGAAKCRRREENLFQPPSDARLVQIVGRHFHFDAVADGEAHPAFAHFAADGGEDEMLVVQLDAEHRAGQDGLDAAFDFDVFFFDGCITSWKIGSNEFEK